MSHGRTSALRARGVDLGLQQHQLRSLAAASATSGIAEGYVDHGYRCLFTSLVREPSFPPRVVPKRAATTVDAELVRRLLVEAIAPFQAKIDRLEREMAELRDQRDLAARGERQVREYLDRIGATTLPSVELDYDTLELAYGSDDDEPAR